VKAPVLETITRRLRHAYPIYDKDYETHLAQIDRWLAGVENLLCFGRQGLFVHDNTHHALFMGYAAAKCLDNNGSFDRGRWQEFRNIFDKHVVED
jgi:protoporphyrinogen oxidase